MKYSQITTSMAKDIAFNLGAVLNDEEAGAFADGYNVALLKVNKDMSTNSPVIPDCWVMVPKEPTDEMIAAAMECDDVVFDSKDPTAFCVQFREIYCAMVDTAPKPEQS
ncbi:hypothetical protein FNI63_21615 [Salmonella enterica subsp. salamae]|nr:hypothetical protein [Salmonella enterica]ECF5973918.1 hypothetical protein [Salmonella enterica subsp. salamae serovar Sofia]ECR8541353.1 hypothetical protein [Salmonella enterica]EGD6368697.1 hypothetical protein [Salmonella enterica]